MKESQNVLQKTWCVCLLALICCALWGSAFPCVKIGYELFHISSDETVTQILFAGCRFTLAGILAIILGSILSGKVLIPKKSSYGKILWLCMLQTVLQYLFFYIGLAHTTGVKASIIEGMNVFISILVASLLFRQEDLTRRKVLGCLIGFAGVVLVNLAGSSLDMGLSLKGEGFILFSTVAYAFSSVYIKKFSEYENPVVLSGYQFVAGGLIMVVCGWSMGGRLAEVTASGIGMLLYLGFLSAVAYSLWGIMIKYNPVSRVSVFGFMNPVFGVLLSAVLLRETDSVGMMSVIALGLVCGGIYIVNHRNQIE